MKKLITLSLLIAVNTCFLYGQNLKAGFILKSDTIFSSTPGRGYAYQAHIKVLKDTTSTLKNLRISLSFLADKSNLSPANILFNQSTYTINDLTKDTVMQIPVRILRDSVHERIAVVQVNIVKADGTAATLDDSGIKSMQIYAEPYNAGVKTNSSFEPFFYVGTNFDLLDGLEPKSLYAKFNLFWKLTEHNFIQMGLVKNRLFSSGDSVNNIPFFNGFRTRKNLTDTTISLVNGSYSKKVAYKNEPLTLYFEYHRKLDLGLAEHVSMFLSGGFEIGLFKTTITNTYSNIIADTTVVKLNNQRFVFQNNMVSEHSYSRPNYLYYAGLMFLMDNDDFNVKMQLMGGLNIYYRVLTLAGNNDIFMLQRDPYFNFKLNSIIKKVGIGFGVEVLGRRSTPPLFGMTLSKVIDLKDIKSVFAGVSTVK